MTDIREQPRRRVTDVMSTPPIMVPADATVAAAAEVLHDEGVGAVFVGTVDALAGVLSERDVLDLVARGGNPSATLVRDAMTSPVVRLDASDTVLDAAIQAVDIAVRHLPVIDGGRVVGVVSTRDLVLPLLLEALTSVG